MTYPRTPKLWFSAICLLFLMGAALADTRRDPPSDSRELDQIFQRSTLQIATPDARLHRFNIWLADDETRRARGLMFVKHLNAGDAMLFVYPQPQMIAMWMKNTFIPLDMLFVAADGKVMKVVANTEPQSLKTIESDSDVTAVIELNGGTASKLRIAKGARVMHAAFASQPPK